jgi:hypothetical protein
MHQTSNFIMNTNRQYDGRFAQKGAKIGQSLDVRLPAKYVTRRGNQMQTQNYVERSVPLPLATIDGIDLNFGQEELTFNIDDFSKRVIRPAVSQLVATVEQEALTMYKKVANYAGTDDGGALYYPFSQVGQSLTEQLAPLSERNMCFQPSARTQFSNDVKGLFQSAESIKKQYVDGILGRTGGFDCYENTIVPAHTVGTYGGTPLTNGASQGSDGAGNVWLTDTDLVTDGWTSGGTTLNEGDIITIAGVFDVHPETKQAYAHLKRFTVNEQVSDTTGDITVNISPAIISGGAYQNVSARPADGAAIVVLGDSGAILGQSLGFHKDAFAFVTADLEDPSQYGAWGAREVFEGLSIRIWRQGDIVNGSFPCRLDLAYGFAPIYPEWAARLIYDPAFDPTA